MRSVSLLAVLIFAKVVTLAGREIPLSVWTPLAYFWQDVLFVMLFAALEAVIRRPWFGWTLYAVTVAFVAINVPLVRAVSTPLTWPMLRAAHGTLSDSLVHYVTWANVLLIGGVVAVAVVVPRGALRLPQRWLRTATVAALLLVCLGPLAAARIDTVGLHRNYVLALITTAVPRISAKPASGDWRSSPYPQASQESLSHLRGAARDHNVVLIILESAGAQYLQPYGAAEDPMPHLTKLARRAILFEQAYTVYPESIKGLLALFSSVNPALDTKPEQYRTIGIRSLAAELGRANCRTGLFHSGRFMYLGMESVIRGRGFDTLEDAGDISGVHFSSFGVDEPSTVRRMLDWIDQGSRETRFFLTYMSIAGHHPYDSPQVGPFPDEMFQRIWHKSGVGLSNTLLVGKWQRGLPKL